MKGQMQVDDDDGIDHLGVNYGSREPVIVPEPRNPYDQQRDGKRDSIIGRMCKLGSYVHGLREHVNLGPKISETVKGKLSLGTRILQAGGVERVFRQSFSVREGEKLVKALMCYLSTTAGPISGMLFISTENIAFLSDRYLTLTSQDGKSFRIPYKVLIPLAMIKRATTSENLIKPKQKYIKIATEDEFEFWFMGFVSYQKFFKYLQKTAQE